MASAAVAELVTGHPREVAILATFPRAVYLEHRDGLLAVVTRDGVHQPNALVLPDLASGRPFAGCHVHQRGVVGGGRVTVGPLELTVTRWWRPRPVLPTVGGVELDRSLVAATSRMSAVVDPLPDDLAGPFAGLVAGLWAEDTDAAETEGRALLGRGPGLTPAGDDLIAGLVAATQLLAPVVRAQDRTGLATVARDVGASLAARAADTTTAVSAALLHHAAVGEVARPAAALLAALVRPGPVVPALDALLAVGATSGRDLATGLLAAGRLVLGTGRFATPSIVVRSGRV